MFPLDATLPDFLTWQDGQVRLRGHRIGLYDIVKRHRTGEAADEIARGFPSLGIAEVCRTLDFYLANRAAVESYIAAYEANLRESEETHSTVDLPELKRRFRELHGDNSATEAILHSDAEHGA